MEKILSGFSITSNSHLSETSNSPEESSEGDNPFDGLQPKQAEYMMKEIESTVTGMDDENPDPKQMGALMRKMSELSGEKIDGHMEEVVRKLEEGVDPKELERQVHEFSEEEGGETNSGDEDLKKKFRKSLNKRLIRDPILYEFADYV